ncbi:shikimate kinase [Halomonas sp. FME1]|uniref:Shikimate kinase n=1 Tax=Halomonas casei TaxID=2742613 RepID=A0ABR9F570_9GAMM|nr:MULTISPECIES: shikimate kinase [Halomonas]MBE0401638.1 shikimate kinase [Halomonas casei]PCC23284.1 shikimate kinase [Halomonas sp. JB37]
MRKIIIFGNSGSGKSTLARKFKNQGLTHLDLDALAWLPSNPPERRPIGQVYEQIQSFIGDNREWVVEGCYADLLELAKPFASEAIFMNLPVHLCQENARKRPWEPHKYESRKAQDDNLPMLLDWIAGYMERDDPLSYSAHNALFKGFQGSKKELTYNENA